MSGLCHLLHSLRGANRPLGRGLAGKTVSPLSASTARSPQHHLIRIACLANPMELIHLSGVWCGVCAGGGRAARASPQAEGSGREGRAKSPALLWTEEVASRRAALPLEQEGKGEVGERAAYLL